MQVTFPTTSSRIKDDFCGVLEEYGFDAEDFWIFFVCDCNRLEVENGTMTEEEVLQNQSEKYIIFKYLQAPGA
jgi:hypothetical protein